MGAGGISDRLGHGQRHRRHRSERAASPVSAPRATPVGSARAIAQAGLGRDESGLRVLVVDDSAAQRLVLTRFLRRWGFEASEAASGEEALERCRAQHVDLVLSDWMMPGLSGPDFCRAFRSLPRSSYGYFILLTSKSDKGAVAEGLAAGADDFLTKPVSPEELQARLSAGARILRMQAQLQEKNRLVTATLAELQEIHESLSRDLAQARQLQQSLVREPQRRFGPWQLSLLLRPSGMVGGDLVGAFPIGTRRVGLFGIDVSGHGVSAALLAARLAGLFSGVAPGQNVALIAGGEGGAGVTGRTPTEVAGELNRLLLDEIGTDHYCTLVYAEVTLQTGALRLVQAGHPHPVVERRDGTVEALGSGGLPVGLFADAQWDGTETVLHPGDRLIITSDGVTECPDPGGAELGEAGLARLLRESGRCGDQDRLDALLAALAAHHGSADFPDDVSLLLFDHAPEPLTQP